MINLKRTEIYLVNGQSIMFEFPHNLLFCTELYNGITPSTAYYVIFHRRDPDIIVNVVDYRSGKYNWSHTYNLSEYGLDEPGSNFASWIDQELEETRHILSENTYNYLYTLVSDVFPDCLMTAMESYSENLYDAFMFLLQCQKRYQEITKYPDNQLDYQKLINVVEIYYKESLPFIALDILATGGLISLNNPNTCLLYNNYHKSLMGQFCNIEPETFYTPVDYPKVIGSVMTDPILNTICKYHFYPVNFISPEQKRNLVNLINHYLNTTPIDKIIHKDR